MDARLKMTFVVIAAILLLVTGFMKVSPSVGEEGICGTGASLAC